MKTHAILIAAVCLLAVGGCAHPGSEAIGGTMELLPKAGLLVSKGLRVRGHDVKPVHGRTKLILKAERLPLSGSNWPYIVELRFKDREHGQPRRLLPAQKSRTHVKLRVRDAERDVHLSGSLSDQWLSPSGADAYYFLDPSVEGNPGAFYLSDHKGIELEVEISMDSDFANRVRCSVSLRTGNTK